MAPDFAPTMLERLVSYVIQRAGRELGGIELAKILYLIDVERLSFLGESLTGEEYVRAPKGPLPRNFRAAIARMNGHEIEVRKLPSKGHSEWGKNCHRPGPAPRFSPDLSQLDQVISDRVLERVQRLTLFQLVELAYQTEPMRAIHAEERAGKKGTRGSALDLGLVPRDERFLRWQRNTKTPREPDPDYEAFLEKEKAEVRLLLASPE
jgi:hypothetical protein